MISEKDHRGESHCVRAPYCQLASWHMTIDCLLHTDQRHSDLHSSYSAGNMENNQDSIISCALIYHACAYINQLAKYYPVM